MPSAILLGGYVTGALPLWMARQATRPTEATVGPRPGPGVAGAVASRERGGGPSPSTPVGGTAGAPLGMALAVALRPLGRGRWATPPRDPLRLHMARSLEAAAATGRPIPPLAAAQAAALAWGAWPRAVAMALGGLRWAGPPLAPLADAPAAAPRGSPVDRGEGMPGDAAPGEGGWPTPQSAWRAAALAAVPWDRVRPLGRRLLLVWPTADGGPAGPGTGDGVPVAEWRWAALWMESRSGVVPTAVTRPEAGAAEAPGTLAAALARESQWLAAWRRRLPAALPVDPRRPQTAAGAPGDEGSASTAWARLLGESAALARSLRDSPLVPPAVAQRGHQLEAILGRLGWEPGRPGGPLVWPAWHLAAAVWALGLPEAPAASAPRLEALVAGLTRAGWGVCRLVPVRTGARLRLSPVVPGDDGGGAGGGRATDPRHGKAGRT